jgi:acyl-coenzyme A synthetase/AMP-(fatty) acid ligase
LAGLDENMFYFLVMAFNLAELGAVHFEDALAQSSSDRGFAPRSSDDLYILSTGGTTGLPKACSSIKEGRT